MLCACSGTEALLRFQLAESRLESRPWAWAREALGLTFVALRVPLVPHWGLLAESPRESGTSFMKVGDGLPSLNLTLLSEINLSLSSQLGGIIYGPLLFINRHLFIGM